ncbi:hypothetical protein Hte_006367 [Hypoxylon texense]
MASPNPHSGDIVDVDIMHSVFSAAITSILFTNYMLKFVSTNASKDITVYMDTKSKYSSSALQVYLNNIRARLNSALTKLKESYGEGESHIRAIVELSQACGNECDKILDTSHERKNSDDASSIRNNLSTTLKDNEYPKRLGVIQKHIKLSIANLIGHYYTLYKADSEELSLEYGIPSGRLDQIKVYLDSIGKTITYIQKPQSGYQSKLRKVENLLELLTNERLAAKTEILVLQHLGFECFNDKLNYTSDAHHGTFQWVFTDSDFGNLQKAELSEWLSSGKGVYWIAGKPGSGKSTLLKFIVSNPQTKRHLNTHFNPNKVTVAAHFFWRFGLKLERSLEGLLRSLLFSLIKHHPSYALLLSPVLWREARGQVSGHNIPNSTRLSVSQLVDSLKTLLRETRHFNSFCFVIDALDECDADQTDLCRLILELARFPNCKICVSSRPSPSIMHGFGRSPDLRLEDYTANDIRIYSNDTLLRDFYNEGNFDGLAEEISRRSNGVFFWTYLTVTSVTEGMVRGDTLPEIQARICELSRDLEYFYKDMLERVVHHERSSSTVFRTSSMILRVTNAARGPLEIAIYHFLRMVHKNANYALDMPITAFLTDAGTAQSDWKATTVRWLASHAGDFLDAYGRSEVVTWFHPTARAFLDTPEIQEMLIGVNPSNPTLSLFKAHIAAIKSGLRVSHHLTEALYYAAQLENSDYHDREAYYVHLLELELAIIEVQGMELGGRSRLPTLAEFEGKLAQTRLANYMQWKRDNREEMEKYRARQTKSENDSESANDETDTESQTEPTYAEFILDRPTDFVSETSESSFGNIWTAEDELVSLFSSDVELNQLFVTAIKDPNIGGQRLERKLHRLLVTYSYELLAFTQVDVYREAAKLVKRSARFIAEDIRRDVDPTGYLTEYKIDANKDDEAAGKRELLNRFIAKQLRGDTHSDWSSTQPTPDGEERENDEQFSDSEESANISEHQHDDGNIMAALEQVKDFLRAGHPLENLRASLRRFVVPKTADTTRDIKAHRDELSETTQENGIAEDSNSLKMWASSVRRLYRAGTWVVEKV